MSIYEKIFINHYHFYARNFGKDRAASVYFLTFVQMIHLYILLLPLAIYVWRTYDFSHGIDILIVISLVFLVCNFFIYNKKSTNELEDKYSLFDGKSKKKSRFTSIFVCSISASILLLEIFFLTYFYPLK